MKITKQSLISGKFNTMDLPVSEAQMREWNDPKRKRYVQDIFPNLSDEQREFLMTGITPKEWRSVFPEGE